MCPTPALVLTLTSVCYSGAPEVVFHVIPIVSRTQWKKSLLKLDLICLYQLSVSLPLLLSPCVCVLCPLRWVSGYLNGSQDALWLCVCGKAKEVCERMCVWLTVSWCGHFDTWEVIHQQPAATVWASHFQRHLHTQPQSQRFLSPHRNLRHVNRKKIHTLPRLELKFKRRYADAVCNAFLILKASTSLP